MKALGNMFAQQILIVLYLNVGFNFYIAQRVVHEAMKVVLESQEMHVHSK